MAFVFLCNTETEGECLKRQLFGAPDGVIVRNHLSKVKIGDTLFLYNYDLGILRGPFEALTPCQANLVPNAFKSMRNRAAWQVKVSNAGTSKSTVSADSLSELGLLHSAPKIGLTLSPELSEEATAAIMALLVTSTTQ